VDSNPSRKSNVHRVQDDVAIGAVLGCQLEELGGHEDEVDGSPDARTLADLRV
jgi:hypothetical protein